MQYDLKLLSINRLQNAKEFLDDAEILFREDKIKSALNRSYYAIFHVIKALFAAHNIDSKSHSGLIQMFNTHFVKAGKFTNEHLKTLTNAEKIRIDSDYKDFYIASKDQAKQQIDDAKKILEKAIIYLENKFQTNLKKSICNSEKQM